ncbi:MAG: hypothetical protein KDK27_06315, partial [Leptospiraceae bacterium]|nr:hypothetical protein [Leptospiraceae bacterium]
MKTTTLQRITMPGRTWWLDEQYRLGTSTAFAWGLKRGKTLFKSRPNMQRIEIFDNEEFGRVLALDGMMQLSTKYEYIYHEMLTHPAVLAHPKPLHALIIGGGDGGVLRELIKYPFERIVMVEIDRAVIELCEKFLPSVSNRAFRDPRLEIIIADAAAYIKTGRHEFDIV